MCNDRGVGGCNGRLIDMVYHSTRGLSVKKKKKVCNDKGVGGCRWNQDRHRDYKTGPKTQMRHMLVLSLSYG